MAETIHVPARQLQVVGADLNALKDKLLENETGWSEEGKTLFYKTAGGDVLPIGDFGVWLGNLTVAEVNALTTHKKGDSATMLDAGIVVPGNVTVAVGDDIMWVDSLGVWQPKVSDHIHHDETLIGTGRENDPLGVNPETIENNVLRMQYRGGGRLKFWRGNPLPTT